MKLLTHLGSLQLLADLIILLVCVLCLVPGFLELLLQLAHPLLVLNCAALKHLPHPIAVIRSGGRLLGFKMFLIL